MLISFDVPLCAFAVGATAVPKLAPIVSLSPIDTPDKAHDTVPVSVPVTVKNALKVITPSSSRLLHSACSRTGQSAQMSVGTDPILEGKSLQSRPAGPA